MIRPNFDILLQKMRLSFCDKMRRNEKKFIKDYKSYMIKGVTWFTEDLELKSE